MAVTPVTPITQVITPLPTAPARTMPPATFVPTADAFVNALPNFGTQENTLASQMNVVAQQTNANAQEAFNDAAAALTSANNAASSASAAVNAPGTSATSASTLTIGFGTQNLTVQTGKAFVPGQAVVIAYTTSPQYQMYGPVISYNSATGALVVNATIAAGLGNVQSAWTVSISAPTPLVRSAATRNAMFNSF